MGKQNRCLIWHSNFGFFFSVKSLRLTATIPCFPLWISLNYALKAQGVELILPDFKGRDRSQMTRDECNQSEFVAQVRIHVERIIQRIRTYHFFYSTAKLSMKDIYESIFMSCAYLNNFQLPIIREEKQPAKDFYMHEQWTDSEWHLLWYSS